MSGLYLPRGESLPAATGAIADLERRVQQGDPTLGWEGDAEMRVAVIDGRHAHTGENLLRWEVWAPDHVAREPYVAASITTDDSVGADDAGALLIRKLVDADTRRRDVVEDWLAKERKRVADERKAMSELHEETAEKVAVALERDLGEGPRYHTIPGGPA